MANIPPDDPLSPTIRRGRCGTTTTPTPYVARVLELADTYRDTSTGVATGDLVTVQGITVDASIADQVDALVTAAAADGLVLSGGGYRSAEQQITLRRAHCGSSQYARCPQVSVHRRRPRPGTSNHERAWRSTSAATERRSPRRRHRASAGSTTTPAGTGSGTCRRSLGTGASTGDGALCGLGRGMQTATAALCDERKRAAR